MLARGGGGSKKRQSNSGAIGYTSVNIVLEGTHHHGQELGTRITTDRLSFMKKDKKFGCVDLKQNSEWAGRPVS